MFDFGVAELGAPVGVVHGEAAVGTGGGVVMLDGAADGDAVVAGGGLDPYFFEGGFAEESAIHGAVERNAAGEA